MRTFFPLRASLLLAALGASLAAHADQIVQNFSIDSRTAFQTVLLNAFNPSLGTLTSVTIALDIQNRGSATFLNRGQDAEGAAVDGYTYGEVDVYRGDDPYGGGYVAGAYGSAEDDETPASGTLAHGESLTAALDYVGAVTGDGAYDNDGNGYETDTGVFTDRATEGFVARTAGERLNADLSDYGVLYTSNLPHSTLTRHFTGLMDASVVYEYTPGGHSDAVPEPAPLAALGLGALALLRRRRA